MIEAVLFDFGGVILSSPFEAFAAYEKEIGLPVDTIRKINATNPDSNAWAKFERREVSPEEFVILFEEEALVLGHELDAQRILEGLHGSLRPSMVEALSNDLGINLKPARAMGMTTIKVIDPEEAIKELYEIMGFTTD